MEEQTTAELESRREHLMSLIEDLEAEYEGRRDALDSYIADEENELFDIRLDIKKNQLALEELNKELA